MSCVVEALLLSLEIHTTPAMLSEQELLALKRWPIYFYITIVL